MNKRKSHREIVAQLEERLAHELRSRFEIDKRIALLEHEATERNKKIDELEAKAKRIEADAIDRKASIERMSKEIDLYERIEDGLAAKIELLQDREKARGDGKLWPLLATAGAAMFGGILGNKISDAMKKPGGGT